MSPQAMPTTVVGGPMREIFYGLDLQRSTLNALNRVQSIHSLTLQAKITLATIREYWGYDDAEKALTKLSKIVQQTPQMKVNRTRDNGSYLIGCIARIADDFSKSLFETQAEPPGYSAPRPIGSVRSLRRHWVEWVCLCHEILIFDPNAVDDEALKRVWNRTDTIVAKYPYEVKKQPGAGAVSIAESEVEEVVGEHATDKTTTGYRDDAEEVDKQIAALQAAAKELDKKIEKILSRKRKRQDDLEDEVARKKARLAQLEGS